jgi:predicted Zn-ribbon and HTH transcriptional regulator
MEKFTTFYCKQCGWFQEEQGQWAMAPKCPECSASLFYVKFDDEERQRAHAIICGKAA